MSAIAAYDQKKNEIPAFLYEKSLFSFLILSYEKGVATPSSYKLFLFFLLLRFTLVLHTASLHFAHKLMGCLLHLSRLSSSILCLFHNIFSPTSLLVWLLLIWLFLSFLLSLSFSLQILEFSYVFSLVSCLCGLHHSIHRFPPHPSLLPHFLHHMPYSALASTSITPPSPSFTTLSISLLSAVTAASFASSTPSFASFSSATLARLSCDVSLQIWETKES